MNVRLLFIVAVSLIAVVGGGAFLTVQAEAPCNQPACHDWPQGSLSPHHGSAICTGGVPGGNPPPPIDTGRALWTSPASARKVRYGKALNMGTGNTMQVLGAGWCATSDSSIAPGNLVWASYSTEWTSLNPPALFTATLNTSSCPSSRFVTAVACKVRDVF
jgi:hypothetical protein